MLQPKVALIVGPRERFSSTQDSLESIYQDTDYPFDLIYVDVFSPEPIQRYLEEKSHQKQFKLLRTNRYISPTQAKNVGLRYILSEAKDKYKYIVFIENDVLVKVGQTHTKVHISISTNFGRFIANGLINQSLLRKRLTALALCKSGLCYS